MFDEDDSGNVLLLPSNRHVTADNVADGMRVHWAVPQRQQIDFKEDGLEQEPLTLSEIDELLNQADLEEEDGDLELDDPAESVRQHVLRELLLEAETHPAEKAGSMRVSSGIRRLRERRVNRTLDVVADWLLSLNVAFAEEGASAGTTWSDDESFLLLNISQDVRGQIAWPEQEDHQTAEELTRQARERGK